MPRVRTLLVWLRPTLLFALGLGVGLVYGRRGFMPLDQSIVFDGGWRMLCGQVPFRDYVAPNGVAVHALQALFFAGGGVSWLVYCLHAAVLNGLFAVVVDRCLRICGAGAPVALGCAAASTLVLTPPMGVPYMDTHAFFFSLVAVWIAIEARRTDSRTAWIAVPALWALAALSKQVPSIFFLPVLVGLALWAPPPRWAPRLRALAVGSACVAAGLGLAALLAGVRSDLVAQYFVEIPGAEAARRLDALPAALSATARDFTSLGVVSALTLPLAGVAGLVVRAPASALRRLALAAALVGSSVAFAIVTLNQAALALPPLFLAAGLGWAGLRQAQRGAAASWAARAAGGLAWLVVAGAVFDAVHFHLRVNATRSANDIFWTPRIAERSAPDLPPALAFLEWQVPPVVPYRAADLAAVADFLRGEDGAFLLLGDASVLYALTGKPSVAPTLWFHAGLSMPAPGQPAFRDYEDWLLARMDALGVRYLVLEGHHTWNHTKLGDFPRLSRRVRAEKIPILRFGGFRIVDLAGTGADE